MRLLDPDKDRKAAAATLRARARALERAAAKNAAVGKVNGEMTKLERAAALYRAAEMLEDMRETD